MLDKIVTGIYLTLLVGNMCALYRVDFRFSNDKELWKIISWICSSYIVGISWVYFRVYHGSDFSSYLVLLTFCPLICLAFGLLNSLRYKGTVNVLLVGILLSSLGFTALYRLKDAPLRGGILVNMLHVDSLPVVLSNYVFTFLSLLLVVLGLGKGWFSSVLTFIEQRTKPWFWGIMSFACLCAPIILEKVGLIERRLTWTVSVSEFAYKVLFVIFICLYLSRSALFLNKGCNTWVVMKTVLVISVAIGIAFIIPLGMQKELGTPLILSIVTFALLATFTGRVWIFFAGISIIVAAMFIGIQVSPHVAERIVGGFFEWKTYVFELYGEGSKYPAGAQMFDALSAVRSANVWGTGLGVGTSKMSKVINDFAAVPVITELGLPGLILMLSGFLLLLQKAFRAKPLMNFRGMLLVCIPLVLLCQAYYNLSFVLHFLPLAGVPICFISSGGSAVITGYFLVGLLCHLVNEERS